MMADYGKAIHEGDDADMIGKEARSTARQRHHMHLTEQFNKCHLHWRVFEGLTLNDRFTTE